jgi:thiamine kinase-like enzyme
MSEALERATGPITLVFGHNDLLAANFLDDGQRLWLIDWDYAGFKSPLVDLANLSSNNGFDATRDDQLLARYFGARGDAVRRHAFEAFKCASLLREALWGAVSERRSSIDFDYATYSREYLLRLDLAWELFLVRSNRGMRRAVCSAQRRHRVKSDFAIVTCTPLVASTAWVT